MTELHLSVPGGILFMAGGVFLGLLNARTYNDGPPWFQMALAYTIAWVLVAITWMTHYPDGGYHRRIIMLTAFGFGVAAELAGWKKRRSKRNPAPGAS